MTIYGVANPRMRPGKGLRIAEELWLRYRCASHGGAIFNETIVLETDLVMADETTNKKDSLRVEKLSLLILSLCIVVLVYVLVAKPF